MVQRLATDVRQQGQEVSKWKIEIAMVCPEGGEKPVHGAQSACSLLGTAVSLHKAENVMNTWRLVATKNHKHRTNVMNGINTEYTE